MNHSLISADNTWALFAILAAIATLAIYLEQKTKIGSKVTGCVMALIFAMVLSNTGIIPLDAAAYDFVWSYIIPLAIPMLLIGPTRIYLGVHYPTDVLAAWCLAVVAIVLVIEINEAIGKRTATRKLEELDNE